MLYSSSFYVEHTKAWFISGTENLMPYIPKKIKIVKWFGTIIGFAIIYLIIDIFVNGVI